VKSANATGTGVWLINNLILLTMGKITKEEFLANTLEQVKENPRAILGSHGLDATVLQTILKRPDVIAKVMNHVYLLKSASKGAAGAKKAPNFKLIGFKSYGYLFNDGAEKIEEFVGGLNDADKASFNNDDSIVALVVMPDKDVNNFGDTLDETVTNVISGQSIVTTFEKAASKRYAIPGAMFILMCTGESAVRTGALMTAAKKEKLNKAKEDKRTPEKIKAELKAKKAKLISAANAQIASIEQKRAGLQQSKFNTEAEIRQIANLGKQFGLTGAGNIDDVIAAMEKYESDLGNVNSDAKAKIAALPPNLKKVVATAADMYNDGDIELATSLLAKVGDPVISDYILKPYATPEDVMVTRKAEIETRISELVKSNVKYMELLASGSYDPAKKRSIQSMISHNNAKLKELKAGLSLYSGKVTAKTLQSRGITLNELTSEIMASIEAGENVKEALDTGLAMLNLTPAQVEAVKQNVVQQLSQEIPMQFAVQTSMQKVAPQVLQQVPAGIQQNIGGNDLSKAGAIQDIMNIL
jgi:hypothetical protein